MFKRSTQLILKPILKKEDVTLSLSKCDVPTNIRLRRLDDARHRFAQPDYIKILLIWFLIFFNVYTFQAQPSHSRDAAEIRLALKKLTILGSVLYIAAHPDDENTALLATMVQGRCYRTAYLSCTRGEGGQNLLGPEQGDLLGLIRTQELLAARHIDGAEQYFTRAIDFGYSKTSDETLRFWGKGKTLSDVVWIIRTFRPDVIITRFTPSRGGHGNHTASAFLALEAFRAASDSTKFPEQLRLTTPWQAKRILWNTFRFSASDTTGKRFSSLAIDLGAYSPLLGRSFTEIAGEGRSMHKSQGFGAAEYRGEFQNEFQFLDGDSAINDMFDGINTNWSRITGGDVVGNILEEAYRTFDDEQPAKTLPLLLQALDQLITLPKNPWIDIKYQELERAIAACAGLWVDATTSENSIVPGSDVKITMSAINRCRVPFVLEHITLPFAGKDTVVHSQLEFNRPVRFDFTVHVPEQIPYTQQYWLQAKPDVGSYNVSDLSLIGTPENDVSLSIKMTMQVEQSSIELIVPVQQKTIDPVEGELLRSVDIVPPVVIHLQEPVIVFAGPKEKTVTIRLKSFIVNAVGTIRLKLPPSWQSSPLQQPVELKNIGDEKTVSFSVRPMNGARSGELHAEYSMGSLFCTQGIQVAKYRHIPPQTLLQSAEAKLLRVNLKKSGNSVGYIMGAGDEIPDALRQMGYSVALLSDEELTEGNLGRFDVIVTGVRAYNTRPILRSSQKRLMDYIQKGGTYVVQYVTPIRNEAEHLGPYAFHVSRDRVTEEDAKVIFINPKNPVLTKPNIITEDDFKGWIQERGLYFADRWDTKYDSVLACHDQSETDKSGGLLTTQYGKGWYVYCAYAFFRQLPAGVEGAYRIFANILSLQSNTPSPPSDISKSLRQKRPTKK